MKISYIRHYVINTIKWDKCIKKAYNGNIYAYSWYLDVVCEGWDALVADDYKIVMPLTGGKKYGLSYLYQPFFTQQLGIFSMEKLSADVFEKFFNAIPKKYRYISINLNIFNKFKAISGFEIEKRVTYELDLIKPYQKNYRTYSTNTRRNLKKAQKNKIHVSRSVNVNELINFAKTHLKNKIQAYQEAEYNMLRIIVSMALRYRVGEIYGAYDMHNTLCAAGFFLLSHNKSIFLLSVTSHEGKDNRAMFALIDHYIKKYSERNLTLDFEGSNIAGIARFYSGFGATPCNYYHLKRNRLPWALRLFKK